MIQPPKENKTPKLRRTTQMNWAGGLNTSGGRSDTPSNSLWTADNIVLNSEGSISSRSPFIKSNIPDLPSAEFVGPIYSFFNPETGKNDLLAICSGILYRYQDGGDDWTAVPLGDGETEVLFSMEEQAVFARYGNLIVIADSVNPMAYYVIEQDGIGDFITRPGSEIEDNPLMALTYNGDTPTKSNYAAYYLVSYVNDFGETAATSIPDGSLRIDLTDEDKPLGTWATPIRVTLSAIDDTLENNTRVRVYRVLSPDFVSPSLTAYGLVAEKPIEEAVDGSLSFVDDGSVVARVIAPQLENSTGGLVARHVTEIDGRLWAIGAGKEYQKIYYTGAAPTDSPYPQFFSGDGGYFYTGYGTSFKPATIKRGVSDDGQVCNFVPGVGRRFNIFSLATTYGNQTVHQFYPSEQRGDDGAYSSMGVLDYLNSIIYPSPSGFKSSGLKASYTNDNVFAVIDDKISDIVSSIPFPVFDKMYGTVYSGKAIWHTGPSSMLVFDAKNGGAWTKWIIPHTWFGSLDFAKDRTALYLVRGKRIDRYSDISEFKLRDTSFLSAAVKASSGRLYVSPEDGREWVSLLQVLFVFSELDGPVKLTLRANSKRGLEVYEGVVTVDQDLFGNSSYEGGEAVPFSTIQGDVPNEAGEFGSISPYSSGPFIMKKAGTSGLAEIRVKVNKTVNFIDWEIESLPGFVSMKLEEFVYEYVSIGVGPDFSSRYNEVKLKTTRG